MKKQRPRINHFSYKEADYGIISPVPERAKLHIVFLRDTIEDYIKDNPRFLGAMEPVTLSGPAPCIIKRMISAAAVTGVGPMAAVAGSIAEFAVRATADETGEECIIDNGGDIYISSHRVLTVGIYTGEHALSGKIGFRISPSNGPLGLCSSSSFLGHSLSFGACDLVTAFSPDGALADAAATWGCNQVRTEADVGPAAEAVAAITGMNGVVIIKGNAVGLAGDVPELVSLNDVDIISRITRHRTSRIK